MMLNKLFFLLMKLIKYDNMIIKYKNMIINDTFQVIGQKNVETI